MFFYLVDFSDSPGERAFNVSLGIEWRESFEFGGLAFEGENYRADQGILEIKRGIAVKFRPKRGEAL